jgi:plastocyanin
MSIPRVLFAIPLLLAGAFLPAAGADPAPAPPGVVGMDHEVFTVKEITVHKGEPVKMVNNSRFLHIIGPGEGGTLKEAAGNPMHERKLVQTDDAYQTAPFNDPGVYYLTCSIHPEMTVKVTVTDCGGCCSPASCG